MFKSNRLLTLCAQTSVHAGSGNDMGGVIDLPIQREKHTGFPKFESSSLKGSLRAEVRNADAENYLDMEHSQIVNYTFGPEGDTNTAASMAVTDARCLLFPVKSVKGVFAWVTCPMVIKRFISDLSIIGIECNCAIPQEGTVSTNSMLTPDNAVIMLDENVYNIKPDESVNDFAKYILPMFSENATLLQEQLETNIAVLSDDDFKMIVMMGTEVLFRNKINPKTGTVEKGALFQEEMLPSETVLYALLMTGPIYDKPENKGAIAKAVAKSGCTEDEFIMNFLTSKIPAVIQLGGGATLGKGLLATKIFDRSEIQS